MNLVLIGYRGTGKSAIGQRLGGLLARPVVSLDDEIVRAAGMAIPAIVATSGWSHFRDLEEVVCRTHGARDGLVIDCGGGVVERTANLASLRANGRVYWLRARPQTIVARIGGDTTRPSLTGDKSFTDEVEEVLARRAPLYRELAHEALDTDGVALDELVATIARSFRAAILGSVAGQEQL